MYLIFFYVHQMISFNSFFNLCIFCPCSLFDVFNLLINVFLSFNSINIFCFSVSFSNFNLFNSFSYSSINFFLLSNSSFISRFSLSNSSFKLLSFLNSFCILIISSSLASKYSVFSSSSFFS